MRGNFWIFLACLSCAHPQASLNAPQAPIPSPPDSATQAQNDASRGVSDPALSRLLEAHWENLMRSSPIWATDLGDHRFDDQLEDATMEGVLQRRADRDAFLAQAKAIQSSSARDEVTRLLFIEQLEASQGLDVCEFEIWSFSPRNNPLYLFNKLQEMHPISTLLDAENFLKRLEGIPQVIDGEIERIRLGIQQGLVANAESSRRVLEMTEETLKLEAEKWPIASAEPPTGFALTESVTQRIESLLRPSLTRYRDFLRDELLPNARSGEQEGLFGLPNGAACYTALIRHHTTLVRSPETTHQLGIDALESIHEEMRQLGEQIFSTGDLASIFSHLRNDPSLRFENSEEVEAKANSALDRAKERMAEAFDPVPQTDCVVKSIPDFEAPYTTIAYYRPSAADGSRPGTYFVNTYAPETRPRFEAEVLAYHEAIPGHHLQIALAHELDATPNFRRVLHMTAFVEGWALYSERLSDEMGLYTGDLDRLGMLSFDSWRAARLVVDTGIHAMGWSRQRAIDFMAENTPLALNNIENEVDRYITTPGQALAYKTGQLEILRMREEAKAALGEAFDIKDFHRVVLGGGAVSLPVLEAQIQAWWKPLVVE
jgi:uncharacterized protein (DUF885 family)